MNILDIEKGVNEFNLEIPILLALDCISRGFLSNISHNFVP